MNAAPPMRSAVVATLALLAAGCGAADTNSSYVDADRGREAQTALQPETATADDGLQCWPISLCGCDWECALVHVEGETVTRLDSEGDMGVAFADCATRPCFDVCEGGQCTTTLTCTSCACTEACPAGPAPFACRRVPGEPIDATGRPCQPDR